ncbi:MAG: carbohydrate kinase family protein [Patescibacteria group bacterium]|jgi:ribokinase
MAYDLISIGGATEDITFYTSEGVLMDNKKDVLRQKLICFEYGAKIKVDRSHTTFGGGAANVAVAGARLGLKTALIACVGNDSRGEEIKKNLAGQNVDTSLMETTEKKETGFSFLLTGPGNEHVVFSNRASNDELSINKDHLTALEEAKWIYITSLSGEWKPVLDSVFMAGRPKIAWNPGHRQLLEGCAAIAEYLKKVEVLILNKDEAIELVKSNKGYAKKDNEFLNDIRNLLKVMISLGPKIVVITNGRHGAYAQDEKKSYFQKIFKEAIRLNTTGVGDAFGSSFIAGLQIYKGNIKKAMLLGVKNTASVVAHYGAQTGLLTRKEII